tara:strand:+ start:444 stop:704 length:261 start_codon:yes stop_codon:yes gene_type:complete
MADLNVKNEAPTITVDDKTYLIEGLSDKSKEILSLHQEALSNLNAIRRQAIIAEVSVNSLAQMVTQSIKEEDSPEAEPETDGTEVQ